MVSYTPGPISPMLPPLNPRFGPHPESHPDWSPPFPPLSAPPGGFPPPLMPPSPKLPSAAATRPLTPKVSSVDTPMKKTAPPSPSLASTLSPNAVPFVPQALGKPDPMHRPMPSLHMEGHSYPHFHHYHYHQMPPGSLGHSPPPPMYHHQSHVQGHTPHPAFALPSRCMGTLQWLDSTGGYMTVKSSLGDPVDVFVPTSEVSVPLLVGMKLECSLLVINARVEAREVEVCKEEGALQQSLEKFRITLGPSEGQSPKPDIASAPTSDCDLASLLQSFCRPLEVSESKLSFLDIDDDIRDQPSPSLASILDDIVIRSSDTKLSNSSSDVDLLFSGGFMPELQLTVAVGDQ